MVASISHVLTPGTPVYGLLKLGAIGSVVGLRIGLSRRDRRRAAAEHAAATPTPAAAVPHRGPHPRSKKKKRRRR